MTITNGYATVVDLSSYLTSDQLETSQYESAIEDASRWVDGYCGRRFYADTTATARKYPPPQDAGRPLGDRYAGEPLTVDDFWDLATLVVTDRSSTLTIDTHFQTEPAGIRAPEENFPYWILRPLQWVWQNSVYPGQTSITVTAKWGWQTVPNAVKRATLMQAAWFIHGRDTRFGIAGFDAVGGVARIRGNEQAMQLLDRFRRGDTAPGFGMA